jgi:microcystin-dependent protein
MWYSTTSTPPGWIPANGAAVSRTTYATLFSLIGTTYGVGDGSATFNVPDVASTTGKYFIRYTTSVGTVTTTSLATSPVGTMLDWPTTSSYPTGFLRADGSAVSRTSYADLFSLIGTTYGTGDGSTTFNLPNLVAAGSGSPVKIIKASLGGTVEPSTVAHAASHAAGGSDPVLLKQSQISDFIFTNEAARDAAITSPVEGMTCYLTSPTVPSATGELVNLPTGVKTIYNGSVWVCVTEIGTIQTANGSTTSTSYTGTLSSGGTNISVTLVTGSSVLIWSSANASCSSAGNSFSMSIAISGAGSFAASDAYRIWGDAPVGNYYMTVGSSFVIGGLTPGTNTFTANYKTSTNTAYFRDRRLVVKGIA